MATRDPRQDPKQAALAETRCLNPHPEQVRDEAFGFSRPSYYEAATTLQRAGLQGLVPAKPGPRGGHKLTEDICARADQQLRGDPGLRPAALAGPIEQAFGVRAHPRSIERALARYRERHCESR